LLLPRLASLCFDLCGWLAVDRTKSVTGCGCVKSDFNTVFADEALYRHAVGRVQRELQSTIVSINDNVLTLMCEYDELKQELNNE